nr:M23 family metallopeptidase [Microbacterium ulmi]
MQSRAPDPPDSARVSDVILRLPLDGLSLVENSPARRVPSHGTDLFATTFAIDLVPVDERGRSAPPGWGALVGAEPPERFTGFGRPVLSPCAGTIVAVHDGEADHRARRSVPALLAYAVTQRGRIRGGPSAIAGNHVVIRRGEGSVFVLLAHLREGSVRGVAGDRIATGGLVGECGNSGNSTQPHVHVQAMTDADARVARGIPFRFAGYRERVGGDRFETVEVGLPDSGSIVEPLRP